MRKNHIDIITLGCSKNLIDSERLLRRIAHKGYTASHDPEDPEGEFVVVNTCGFISDAKEESINMILNLGTLKNDGKIGKIIVMGCLSERYKEVLPAELPEVDSWFGKYDWTAFLDSLPDVKKEEKSSVPIKDWERTLSTPPWSAYLKISEGCDRMCAYCAIPIITGRHKSRPQEEILEEVRSLVADGVKELNIIAQDLSSYGLDRYGRHALSELVDKIARIDGVEWIRLHYLYPTDFPEEILDVMNRHENVCKYLDIALQHISDKVLSNMNRKVTKEETLELLNRIRERVPGIHLRTTIMTGFPGEDDEAFAELLDFVKTQKFDRLGGFAYCEEEDTTASKLYEDNIPQTVKEERFAEIMALQQEIAEELNREKIGKTLKVLVEEIDGDLAIGRSEFDSPEVDQEVIIKNNGLKLGEFVNVIITDAEPFTLFGEILET